MEMVMEEKNDEVKYDKRFPAFPFRPYPIQIDFMNALYDALDKGGIAMLESPTGTGKTLSIICSALQWLVDRKRQPTIQTPAKHVHSSSISLSNDEPDWMREFTVLKEDQKCCDEVHDMIPSRRSGRIPCGKECKRIDGDKSGLDEEFLVDEYESEDEENIKRKCSDAFSSSSGEEKDEGPKEQSMKIYFCSRTHSQLSQFVEDLRKTVFASELNVICLGSRKNLCINSDVLKLGSNTRINERCLELQKFNKRPPSKMKIQGHQGGARKVRSFSGCPMFGKHKLKKQFKNDVMQQGALDIEDLVNLGNKIGTCPYYGSRNMIPVADLVVLPYQSLLLRSSRESLGLNLKSSIVIIDEAHNLADSLTNMYNAKVTLLQLEQVHSHLDLYLDRFQHQLGDGNRRYIQTLMVLTRAFLRLLLESENDFSVDDHSHGPEVSKRQCSYDTSMSINDFLFALAIDNINLVKMCRYIKESNIVYKVNGYGKKVLGAENLQIDLAHSDDDDSGSGPSSLSGFQGLVDLLASLVNNDSDGRIIISRGSSMCSTKKERYIKYVMLAGEKIFFEIVDQAHAVILAGGTLQPIEETKERLFPWISSDSFHFFACNHIVPPDNIMPIAVPRGPSGISFDFSYKSRNSQSMMEELGFVCNLVGVVPEGIVLFFSSFEYEKQVYDTWKALGILARILKKKKIFREPRSNADVENLLQEYKETIMPSKDDSKERFVCNGALLLAIVGGKISEGINLSDGMGRCVVMVGLPYPNLANVELMERIKHIERQGGSNLADTFSGEACQEGTQSCFGILKSCKHRGREYYENLCMKAVNQSIGRAIRHINDYAAILLVDSRYATLQSDGYLSSPTQKLPHWVKSRLVTVHSYGEVHRLLYQFFQSNKQKE